MMRTLWPLAALAVSAVIVAGCGNGSAGTASSGSNSTVASSTATVSHTSTDTTRTKAVKFAECMRASGVSAFPDPDASGELTIDAVANGSSVDTDSAAFEQAMSACKDLQPPGFTGHRRTPEQQKAALEFAQCMRDSGVPDFPDPGPDDPLIDTNRIPSAAGRGALEIPGFQAATGKCEGFLAGAGVTGGK
jgi:hypothetical protein